MEQETKRKKSIEELLKWQEELYELEKYVVSGRGMAQERMDKNVKDFFNPNYTQRLLSKAQAHKKKLLEDFDWTEKRIQFLANEIQKKANNKSS